MVKALGANIFRVAFYNVSRSSWSTALHLKGPHTSGQAPFLMGQVAH